MSELPIITLKEAAERLGVTADFLRHQAHSPSSVATASHRGLAQRIKAQKIGRDWYVDRAAVEAEIERRRR